MQENEIEVLLADYFSLPPRSGDPELAAVEAALFVEQTFGIRLADDDITPAALGTPESVRRVVLESPEGL